MSESDEAQVFRFSEIDWDRPEDASEAARTLAQRGVAAGARRKKMAKGEGGFFMEHSYLPPGFEVPPHRHAHSELLIVIEGGCKLSDGTWLTDYDSAYVPGGQEYGFVVGPIGMRFCVVRGGESGVVFSK